MKYFILIYALVLINIQTIHHKKMKKKNRKLILKLLKNKTKKILGNVSDNVLNCLIISK